MQTNQHIIYICTSAQHMRTHPLTTCKHIITSTHHMFTSAHANTSTQQLANASKQQHANTSTQHRTRHRQNMDNTTWWSNLDLAVVFSRSLRVPGNSDFNHITNVIVNHIQTAGLSRGVCLQGSSTIQHLLTNLSANNTPPENQCAYGKSSHGWIA